MTEPLTPKSKHVALEAKVDGIDDRLTGVEQNPGGGSGGGYISLSAQPQTGFTSPNSTVLTAWKVRLSVGTAGKPVSVTGVYLSPAPGQVLSTADIYGVSIFDLNDVQLDALSGSDVAVTTDPGGAALDVTGAGYPLTIPRGGYLEVEFGADVQLLATNQTSTAGRNWSNTQALDSSGLQAGRPCMSAVLPEWRGVGALSAGGMRVVASPTALGLSGFEIVDPEDTSAAPTLRFCRWDGTLWSVSLTAE
ncbi:hypothetical protein [Deinococcus radiotolerans]|uniref:Minor tail protein n=1 Tax=Deinococcus radiotolerans TaxID=1309407 RepID=A0ABQ2FR36_9DEIO|nr:hypothetical protein [Deinococcus radiotolerans]GGL18212.1 hypothetical protein GCM10010844_41340 [Deinococcus radiotolerans]